MPEQPAGQVPPLDGRVVTDYTSLPPGYVDYLQTKMDEQAARQEERHAS